MSADPLQEEIEEKISSLEELVETLNKLKKINETGAEAKEKGITEEDLIMDVEGRLTNVKGLRQAYERMLVNNLLSGAGPRHAISVGLEQKPELIIEFLRAAYERAESVGQPLIYTNVLDQLIEEAGPAITYDQELVESFINESAVANDYHQVVTSKRIESIDELINLFNDLTKVNQRGLDDYSAGKKEEEVLEKGRDRRELRHIMETGLTGLILTNEAVKNMVGQALEKHPELIREVMEIAGERTGYDNVVAELKEVIEDPCLFGDNDTTICPMCERRINASIKFCNACGEPLLLNPYINGDAVKELENGYSKFKNNDEKWKEELNEYLIEAREGLASYRKAIELMRQDAGRINKRKVKNLNGQLTGLINNYKDHKDEIEDIVSGFGLEEVHEKSLINMIKAVGRSKEVFDDTLVYVTTIKNSLISAYQAQAAGTA